MLPLTFYYEISASRVYSGQNLGLNLNSLFPPKDRFDTIVFKSSVVLSPIWIIIVDDGGDGDDNIIISLSSLYYQFFRMI